jgi:hypothetical protein
MEVDNYLHKVVDKPSKVDVNKAMVYAIKELDIDKIKELLASGADPTYALANMIDLQRSGWAKVKFRSREETPILYDLLELLLESGADLNGPDIDHRRSIMAEIVFIDNINLLDYIVKKYPSLILERGFEFREPNGLVPVEYVEKDMLYLLYGIANGIVEQYPDHLRRYEDSFEQWNTGEEVVTNELQKIKAAIISVLPRLTQYIDLKREREKLKNILNYLKLYFDTDEATKILQDALSVNAESLRTKSKSAFTMRRPLLEAYENARTRYNNNSSGGRRRRRRRATKRRHR